ncbi:MAG TPA: YqgE/AlgH family protein [Pirellulales bacterium]|nr:YqgE/AlgH family protein [Pirellulales bacterium]
MPPSLQGHLLVAAPELRDPNFYHTVVLLVQHGQQGALGLVLNRPTEATLSGVWKQVSDADCRRDDPMHIGGPVEGPLMALHMLPAHSENEVLPGLHFCASRENLEQLVLTGGEARFFAGFAGWGAGQLEGELAEGAWRTVPASCRHVFSNSEALWEHALKEAAGSEVLGALKIKHIPPDPSMN